MTNDSTRRDDRVLPLPPELAETAPHPPPARAAPAPRRIGGYEVERELARGGMGVVYVARSIRLERRVALKVLRSGAHAERDEVERFLIEARAAARLKHPGIVALHEADRDGDVWFLAMDLIEGESLRAKVVRDGPLPPRVAAALGRDVALALQYAHERGVLHRDVKPHNVLVDQAGAAFLTDFGLAKEVEREGITVTGDVLGTPAYMAPEQASGERARIDRRSDVYSLGATLYELVTGRPPFQGSTMLNVLRAVLEDEPVAPSRVRPGVGRDLETVILTCLAKDPTGRYDTCALLAADLDRVLGDEPIHVRRPGLIERALRAGRKHRRAVQALSLALVTLVLVAAGVAVATERAQRAQRVEEARAVAEATALAYGALPRSRARLRAAQDALDAARRWHAVDPHDPASLRARSLAAFTLGDEARELEEWTSACEAYLEAGACELEPARADAAVRFCEDMFDARRHIVLADSPRALALLTSCIERPGCYAEAWLTRGAILASLGRIEEGILDFTQVIDRDPRDLRALFGRASMLFELARHAEAARDIDQALTHDPRNAYGHLLRASILRARGDLPGALATCQRAVELDPEGAGGWRLLGTTRFQAGDLDGARAALRRARELDAEDAEVAADLLAVELNGGDQAGMAALVETVTRAPAREEKVVLALAQHHVTVRGDLRGALVLVDEFLARRPASPRVVGQRALLRLALGDLDGAASDAELAAALGPGSDLAHLARARVRLARGDLVGAEGDVTTAIELAPNFSGGYLLRAEIREQADDLPGFLADAERAFALQPRRPDLRVARGRALLANGQTRAAEEIFSGLIDEQEELVDALVGRAQARVLLNELAAAVGDAARAHALAPDEPELDLLLAGVRARAGDRAGAIIDVERYLSRVPAGAPAGPRARELLEALRR